MAFPQNLEPEHLASLTAVFDDICAATGIQRQSREGQDLANLILDVYGSGHQTPDALRARLAEAIEDIGRP